MGLPEIPEPPHNMGSPRCLFGIRPQYIIYLLGLLGGKVFRNRRIIIDCLGLLRQAFGVAEHPVSYTHLTLPTKA